MPVLGGLRTGFSQGSQQLSRSRADPMATRRREFPRDWCLEALVESHGCFSFEEEGGKKKGRNEIIGLIGLC